MPAKRKQPRGASPSILHFGETYQGALASFMPFLVGVRLKDGSYSNIDKGSPTPGAIKPGDFLTVANLKPQVIRPVPDDDAPYSCLAVDREYGNLATAWAWIDPMRLRRIGSPRLDRVADLA